MDDTEQSETFRCLPYNEGGRSGSCNRIGMSYNLIYMTPGHICPYCSNKVVSEKTKKPMKEIPNPISNMIYEMHVKDKE